MAGSTIREADTHNMEMNECRVIGMRLKNVAFA
jgi:hypothetical protein